MKIYHFLSTKFALKDLREGRLKISRLDGLNDPFEFAAADMTEVRFRHAWRGTIKHMASRQGVICFCDNWRNPLMWAHYGDRHKGICLGFETDLPSDSLVKITYVAKRLRAIPFENSSQLEREEFLTMLTSTKYEQWSYEGEYRLHISFDDPPDEDGHRYFEFNEKLRLKEVILGAECGVSRAEIRYASGSSKPQIECFRVRAGFGKFEMVRDKSWKGGALS